MLEYLISQLGPFQEVIDNIYLLVLLNAFFIFATITDIKYMKIYDKFNILMLLTRIISFFIFGFNFSYIIGGALMFVVILFGALLSKAQIGGDIKFSGNIGLWLGFMPSVYILFIAIIINFIFRKITKNTKAIPLAPFLFVGFLVLFTICKLFL